MKLALDQITESPKDLQFSEGTEELNRLFADEKNRDFRFPPFLDVHIVYYRSGQELFFKGWFRASVEGCCGRCLEYYSFPLEKEFAFVLAPEPLEVAGKRLSRDEMGLSFYAGKEIHLSPFVREQLLLALPMHPLCDERCRGLCAGCGVNLNEASCLCSPSEGDPRMALFRTLRLGR